MKVTKAEFEDMLRSHTNANSVAFIGMSGSGKSHWSKQFSEKYGYKHIEFDSLIGRSEEFATLISPFPGKDEAEKMGNYFGMPWNDGFDDKERMYLDLENMLMRKTNGAGDTLRRAALDLTGSCIYHPEQMRTMRELGFFVYLETSPEKQQELFKTFMDNPKPVCWGGTFNKKEGETNEEALQRCYPRLLNHRAHLYQRFADITLPYEAHKNATGVDGFVQQILDRLE